MRGLVRSAAFVAALLVLGYGLIATRDAPESRWLAVLAVVAALLVVTLWPSAPKGAPVFERSLTQVASLVAVGFILVSVQLVRMQIVEASSIASQIGYKANGEIVMDPRPAIRASNVARGRILAADGEPIVDTVQGEDGRWERVYGDPAATYVAGYYSPALYGMTNLEAAYDAELNGETGGNPATEWLNEVLHRTQRGYDLTLTLNLDLQRQADALLGDRRGSVVLMDAKTGAIVAMVSKPHEDPSRLATRSGEDSDEVLESVRAYWAEVNQQPGSPLISRATQGLYAPGSVFKTVTAAAALATATAAPDTIYRDEGSIVIGSRVIPEVNRPDPNQVNFTLTESYAYSLNVVFAQIGMQLGPQALEQYAARFGFGQPIPFDIPVHPSQLASSPGSLTDQAELAVTAFGQGQLLVTPLQMALVANAVANEGKIMQPYLVERISTYDGKTLQTHQPEVWKEALSPEIAEQMRAMMLESVRIGWASNAQIPGYQVGGKTGTAEVGGDQPPHAWFIGFAGESDPEYVVAVVVENGGEGMTEAVPIGREMLQAALEQHQP